MKLELSPAAVADLQSISNYTVQTWGEEQEAVYLGKLWRAMEAICESPASAKSRDDLFPGCRSVRESKHVIFFRHTGDIIEVIRILHAAMDFASHLPQEF